MRSFVEIIQHPQIRLGVLNCAKLRGQKKYSERKSIESFSNLIKTYDLVWADPAY